MSMRLLFLVPFLAAALAGLTVPASADTRPVAVTAAQVDLATFNVGIKPQPGPGVAQTNVQFKTLVQIRNIGSAAVPAGTLQASVDFVTTRPGTFSFQFSNASRGTFVCGRTSCVFSFPDALAAGAELSFSFNVTAIYPAGTSLVYIARTSNNAPEPNRNNNRVDRAI